MAMVKIIGQQVKDLLTQNEIDLLHEVIEDPIDIEVMADILVSHASKQMLKALAESDDIMLVACKQQKELRFPLYLSRDKYADELKELGPPDIIEHNGLDTETGRFWRLLNPKGLKVFDEAGDILLGCIINISTSGMFMLCTDQQYDYISNIMQIGDNLTFYLKIPARGFHLLSANIVRLESETENKKGLALNFDIDENLAHALHEYIAEEHEPKTP